MRNKSLDAVKALAAFGVVFIHISFPGQAGEIIKALARFAVPFFFMVSGYFCYYKNRNIADKIPAKVIHIVKLLVFAMIFYFIWEWSMRLAEEKAIRPWLLEITRKEHIKELFRYNSTSQIRAHLWFLPALIYCYILDYLIEKIHLRKAAYLCIPVLMGIFLWRAYFGRLYGTAYRTMEYRNYFFMGMPFYLTGQMIHEYQHRLKKIPCFVLNIGILLGAGITIWECLNAGVREVYPGSIVLVLSVFLLCVLYDSRVRLPHFFTMIGENFAFPVYLFHLTAADIMKILTEFLKFNKNIVYLWFRPVLVCEFTILVIMVVYRLCSMKRKCGIVFWKRNNYIKQRREHVSQ